MYTYLGEVLYKKTCIRNEKLTGILFGSSYRLYVFIIYDEMTQTQLTDGHRLYIIER